MGRCTFGIEKYANQLSTGEEKRDLFSTKLCASGNVSWCFTKLSSFLEHVARTHHTAYFGDNDEKSNDTISKKQIK